ncbi:MAG: MFS transporter, partial [Dehalococcoidia bacterium]|nr:MFS transporter [Dehalococcoidia bacterium]
VMNILLPAVQTDFGMSFTALGLLAASYDWGNAVLLILGGYLSDRYGKARLILIGLAWFVVVNAATGLAPSAWSLIGLRFAAGFAFGTYFTAGNSLLAEAFAPAKRGRAIGLHYAGGSVGRFVIPILAGAITTSIGWRPALLPLSVAATAAAVLFIFLKWPTETPVRGAGPSGEALWKMLKNQEIIKISAVYFLIVFANTEVIFIPVYLVRTWSLTITEAAFYMGIAALVSIPAALILGELSDRLGWKKVVMATLAADGLLLVLFPFAAPGLGLAAVLLGLGIANRCITVGIAMATRASEPAHRAMSLGLINTVGIAALTVLSVLGGYIADIAGLSTVFFFISAVAIVGCIALWVTRLELLALKW